MAQEQAETPTGFADMLAFQLEAGVDLCLEDAPTNKALQGKPAAEHLSPQLSAAPLSTAAPHATAALPGLDDIIKDAHERAARAKTLAELKDVIAGFEGLSIRKTATNLVFADGNPASGIMVIGEAPGADEDAHGLPFVGVSGKLLDKMLAAIGLDRGTCYITNILNWRPPGNRTPTTQEIAASLPFVRRHIALARPRLVLLAGGVAAKTLLETETGIYKLRGRWHDLAIEGLENPIRVLATFHPSYLLRSPAQKGLAWNDLQMFRHEMQMAAK